MVNIKEFYKAENEKTLVSYKNNLLVIKDIYEETKGCSKCRGKVQYAKFFNHTAKWILKMTELEQNMDENYFENKSFQELKEENYDLHKELLAENYGKSYANPAYCVEIFGDEIGQVLSALYIKYREYILCAYKHKIFKMEECNRLFIEMFNEIKNSEPSYEALKNIMSKWQKEVSESDARVYFKEIFNAENAYNADIINSAELSDLRYLFKFGGYITENEIKTAEFLLNYSEDKIDTLTKAIVLAYKNGFIRDNKDITIKSTVKIVANIGQERIARKLLKEFNSINLQGSVSVVSSDINKQYDYDHRFDNAVYLDEEFALLKESAYENSAENSKDMLKKYSGILFFEKFGEKPFAPENKSQCLKLSEVQNKLMQTHRNSLRQIMDKYVPGAETSFCIIAFPSPEIGEKFEEIFEDTLVVNMMDSTTYEVIQQTIIDTLDKGEYVHVKGNGNNETDIKVKMQHINNPEKETNFVNCVADVNIPLGEVFTSPMLKGTNGMLHLEEVYLDGLKYVDLKLTFKDGYVSEYACRNFESEEENIKYVEENLLFPHKTLPIGEFAIGTNTFAYVMAQKHDIVNILPVLIVEKMGPHFAIGDTCFSWSEDTAVYNPLDKKEITARDNDKSLMRKTDINQAYTNVHTDITLPYDSLEFISVITEEKEIIEIIRNGRFVLAGTEELNKPFEK
jgi:aminopeptidase